MFFKMISTWPLLIVLPCLAQNYGVYGNWRDQEVQWIRVGLKKPQSHIKLYSAGKVLVLDGDQVVQTIQPGGEFRVVMGTETRGSGQYWVQIRAARDVSVLTREKTRVEAKFPQLNLEIQKANKSLKALRIGPYPRRKQSLQVQAKMVVEGYEDAFVYRSKSGVRYFWVNKNFDKFPLRSKNLSLVRPNPEKTLAYGGKSYRGLLHFRKYRGKIRVINKLPLEVYLRGVVPTEMGPQVFPELEALKAQAIAARTYALKNMGRFATRGYDICDGPACQAYAGKNNEHPLSDEAVAATRDLVLYHGGRLIDALYTSTCGGHTEDVENVFPGRAEPYLRGKSSYLAAFKHWELPTKAAPVDRFAKDHEDLVIRALIYGFENPPDLTGVMTQNDFRELMARSAWLLGPLEVEAGDRPLTHEQFWANLARLTFFENFSEHQLEPSDTELLLRYYRVPAPLQGLASFLLRYDLIGRAGLDRFSLEEPITKVEAFSRILGFCEVLGPEKEWKRYRMEGLEGEVLNLSRGSKIRRLKLSSYSYYVTEIGGRLEFRERPYLEELDRIYLLQEPFQTRILKFKESGGVASVDRFSPFDSWLEKKDLSAIEARARRYVKGLKGLKDIKILSRSEAGRVTALELVTDHGNHKVTGLKIRWSMGVKDNFFDLLPAYKNGRLVHATFVGRGWGHGVGMSQVGAYGLARMGWSFDRILTHYYTDVAILPYGRAVDEEGKP